jgi:hypothetical protein
VRLVPLGLGDVFSIDDGHRCAALVEARVAFDAEQHERRDDQDHQEAHEVLLVIADGIEHALNPATWCRRFRQQKRRTLVRLFDGGGC